MAGVLYIRDPVTGEFAPVPVLVGPQGAPGAGVPAGGTAGQVLVKSGEADHETKWADNIKIDATLTQEGMAADARAVGDVVDSLNCHKYNVTVSSMTDKIQMAVTSESLKTVGKIGFMLVRFHVTTQPDNQEQIIQISGFKQKPYTAIPFLGKGVGSVFFSLGAMASGDSVILISAAGNDTGEWFQVPLIILFE